MKTLLIVHQAIGFGGMEVRLLDWLRHIDYSTCEVFVASPSKPFLRQLESSSVQAKAARVASEEQIALFGCYDPNIGIERLRDRSFGRVFRPWLRFLLRLRPNHVVMMEGNFQMLPLAAVLAAFIVSRGNVYMTEHNSYLLEEPPPKTSHKHFGFLPGLGLWWYRQVWLKRWPWRMRSRLCKRILAASDELKDRAIRFYGYPAKKMGTINHGVDTERFAPSPAAKREWRRAHSIPIEDSVIVSTARLAPEKRIERLIEAFELLEPKHPDAWLLLVGEGPLLAELERRIAESHVRPRIKLLGHVQDVAPILQASDIYVLPSDLEGFGIALVEAMASGLICVSTRTVGPPEIIHDGQSGFLVDFSPEGVLKGLETALKMTPSERELVGERARQTAVQKYEVRKAVKNALEKLGIAYSHGRTVASKNS